MNKNYLYIKKRSLILLLHLMIAISKFPCLIRSAHSSNDKRGGGCIYYIKIWPLIILNIQYLPECINFNLQRLFLKIPKPKSRWLWNFHQIATELREINTLTYNNLVVHYLTQTQLTQMFEKRSRLVWY